MSKCQEPSCARNAAQVPSKAYAHLTAGNHREIRELERIGVLSSLGMESVPSREPNGGGGGGIFLAARFAKSPRFGRRRLVGQDCARARARVYPVWWDPFPFCAFPE